MDRKINNIEQLCSVKKIMFMEGYKCEALLVDNGCLSFVLLIDNCLDIYQLRHKGVNISFISKNGLLLNNSNFVESFPGGMLYTCGLDVVGNRTPMHGKIHNIPAKINYIKCNEKEIEIQADIRQSGLFVSNLLLRRTIKTSYNSGKVIIENQIINEGYNDASYCLLFHMNIGYPMLDEGVKIICDSAITTPRTDFAKKHLKDCFIITDPIDDEEQVFFHKVKNGNVSVVNNKISKMVSFSYNNEKLPELIQWKSMVAKDYALGIEPSTTTLDDDFKLNNIKAKESIDYNISIEIKDI